MTTCILIAVHRRFKGTCCLHPSLASRISKMSALRSLRPRVHRRQIVIRRFVVTTCPIGLNRRVYTDDTTRHFKPTEHIATTKLSFHNLSPVYTGPKCLFGLRALSDLDDGYCMFLGEVGGNLLPQYTAPHPRIW
jgi:hypothetical protein